MSIDGRRSNPDRSLDLSLIMPGLNEEKNVEPALRRSVEALEQHTGRFEIIVIDDGSTDRTGEIAEKFAAQDPRIRVLRNGRNRNYGVSLKRGLAAARYEWILHDGMDLPLAPEDLPRFLDHFEKADVVVARRTSRAVQSPWRRLTGWTNQLLLRLLFAPRTRDLTFVQFYRRSFVKDLTVRSTSPAFVTPELILRAEHAGKTVVEVQAVFRRRESGKAHFGKPKDIAWTLRDMLGLRLHTLLRGWRA